MNDPLEFIGRHFDHALSPAEFEEMSTWIKADPANARLFAREAIVHSHLRDLLVGQHAIANPADDLTSPIDPSETAITPAIQPDDADDGDDSIDAPATPLRRSPPNRWRRAAIVLLPLLLALAAYLTLRPGAPVATLTAVIGARWDDTHASLRPGDAFPAGVANLKAGFAQVRLSNGVSMIVQAPARFQINTPQSAELTDGSLTSLVPVGARGFSVKTPSANVVDLGTEFGIHVAAGSATAVEVFQGSVRAEPATAGATAAKTLVAGQSASVSTYAVALSPAGHRFVRTMGDASAAASSATLPAGPPPLAGSAAPAPLFDDPIFHGAADPAVLWSPARGEWLMYYTQRRSTLTPIDGLNWMHGTAIGLASSKDGVHWNYVGTCAGDDDLTNPLAANCTWWSPTVLFDRGAYHLFVTYVQGVNVKWSPRSTVRHFVSDDGINWHARPQLQLSSDRCNDPHVRKIGNKYYLWFKDMAHGSHTWLASSDDLDEWQVVGEVVGAVPHSSPSPFGWRGRHWMAVNAAEGVRIYESSDGLTGWSLNGAVLTKPGTRTNDNAAAQGPCVVVQGDRAILFYFVQYRADDPVYDTRRSVIQTAELTLDPQGKVACERDPPKTQ